MNTNMNLDHPSTNPQSQIGNPKSIWRYFSIYAALWKNSVAREMSFKTTFLLWIFVECLWFGLQLSFISVIYLQTSTVASWTEWQVVLLVGTSQLIQQVFHAFFLINCTQLSELVRTGKLDFLMLLPVNTRFIISLRQVDLGAFVNAALAVGVIICAAVKLHLTPTFLELAGFLVLCLAGILIHYSLMFLLAGISFWTVRAQGIVWGYYNLFQVARLPDEAFQRGAFKAFFTFAIPMLLVSNVPARLLAHKVESPGFMILLLGMCAVCLAVSEWGWRQSLRRYTSASS